MTSDAEDFTHVSHKKVRTPKHRKGKSNRPRERTVAERVEARRGALETSSYLAACRGELSIHYSRLIVAHPCFVELLRDSLLPSTQPGAPSPCPPPVCIVCLGLGSVADSRKSQEQFILLQGLVEELGDAVRPRAELPTGLRRLTFR